MIDQVIQKPNWITHIEKAFKKINGARNNSSNQSKTLIQFCVKAQPKIYIPRITYLYLFTHPKIPVE